MALIALSFAGFVGCATDGGENFIPVQSIVIDDVISPLNVGDEIQLFCTINPQNATKQNIYWTSDNQYCVLVSLDGLAQAISPGTATITAMSYGGQVHSIRVDVIEP